MTVETMPAEQSVQSKEEVQLSTSEKLDAWSARIDRLNSEVESGLVQHEYPEWWYENAGEVNTIKDSLREGNANPADISRYINLYTKRTQVATKITGYEFDDPLGDVIYDLGAEVVAQGFSGEDEAGVIHTALAESLSKIANDRFGVATEPLRVLQKAYGLETITQVLGVKGEGYEKSLHQLVLAPRIITWMRHNDQAHYDGETYAEAQAASRTWMASGLEAATGISHEEAMDYAFSASRRGEDESVVDIIKKFDRFGVDTIRKITKVTGIVGLETYSNRQLERMVRFVDDPEGFAAAMQDHDVSILMVNRVGDHNGVLSSLAAEFDDTDTERTLFFEISSAYDIVKSMVMLNGYGIEPSTLVLAAHSGPGQFIVSDERMKNLPRDDVVAITGRKFAAILNLSPERREGVKWYSMHGMKGMARLVDEYMRPSRAIDDDSQDEGRKKIIFAACDAGTETKMGDIDERGEKYEIGAESVISQLGKDLISSGVETNVDIYGAPAGVQVHRNERGVHYSSEPVDSDFTKERPHLDAIRVRVEDGKFHKEEVSDIILRKPGK